MVLKDVVMAVELSTWLLILGLTVLSVLGVLLGMKWGKHLPSDKFRTVILWVLVGLGLKVGWQGVQELFL